MQTPHKHADVIKAWADGAKIQFRSYDNEQWENVRAPVWSEHKQYRVKPEKKSPGQLLYQARGYVQWELENTTTKGCYEFWADKFLNAMKEQE